METYNTNFISGDSSTYSTIIGGLSCTATGSYASVIGSDNSSIVLPPNHNIPFFHGSRMVGVPESVLGGFQLEKKKVRIRYNHQCKSSKDMWKLYVDSEVYIVSQVNFEIPTATTLDFDDDSKDYKAHISCNAKNIKFEDMPDDSIIVTIS